MPKIKVKGQMVQTEKRPQTNGRTHTQARYQTYYLLCYAVDKNGNCLVQLGLQRAGSSSNTESRIYQYQLLVQVEHHIN